MDIAKILKVFIFHVTDGQLRLQRPQIFTRQIYLTEACRVGWRVERIVARKPVSQLFRSKVMGVLY